MVVHRLKRILHVEDDESIRAVARVALETVGGLSVLSCAGGAEALARAHDFAPQLLLIDVMMPAMDGPATLAALAATLDVPALPVVFMTARSQPSDHVSYAGLGVDAVIVKPFDPMRLATQVESIWERFHARHRI